MGNMWRGNSDHLLNQAEQQVFTAAGIDPTTIVQQDINLDGNSGSQNYIHHVILKPLTQGLPKILLIHGFGGGAGVFCRMGPFLQTYFEVILVDLLGMGASGRPDFNIREAEPAVDYFVDSLRAYIDKTKLTQFYLLGHSFGGYIACEYALRYPEQITQLILMSPVGLPEVPDRLKPENLSKVATTYLQKLGYQTFMGIWNNQNFAPFDGLRVMGGHLAYKVISSSVKRRMRNLTEDMGTKLCLYIHQIMMKPRGSETAITAILAPFAFARNPLVNRIGNLKLKITFLYGKYDWMERETAEDLVEKKVVSGCVYSIPEAGHHLYIENPKECVAKILIHSHSVQTSNKFLKSW